jgi:hypothetical protein
VSFENTHTGKLVNELGQLVSNELESCLENIILL